MPERKFYKNDLLNVGYVYTDISKDQIQIVAEDMGYRYALHTAGLLQDSLRETAQGQEGRQKTDDARPAEHQHGGLCGHGRQTWTMPTWPNSFRLVSRHTKNFVFKGATVPQPA